MPNAILCPNEYIITLNENLVYENTSQKFRLKM